MQHGAFLVVLAATLSFVVGAGGGPAVAHPAQPRVAGPILYVGDSLGVGTVGALRSLMPSAPIDGDARVGRSSTEGLRVVAARQRGRHRVVVFDLGTNDRGAGTLRRNLERARKVTGSRVLVVFTLNMPAARSFNRVIRDFSATAPNVLLVDWHAAARAQSLLASDGIHASPSGYVRRAGLVARALRAATAFPGRERPNQGLALRPRWAASILATQAQGQGGHCDDVSINDHPDARCKRNTGGPGTGAERIARGAGRDPGSSRHGARDPG